MGVKQNLKLWENNVTHIDENGDMVTECVPRVLPPNPWKVMRMLSAENYMFFFMGLYVPPSPVSLPCSHSPHSELPGQPTATTSTPSTS